MLEVRDLEKSYGEREALRGISFQVREGEIFGLLGPNGAGKTTAVSIIATLLRPDSGRVLYEGRDVFSNLKWWRRKIGFVPQEMAFYEELSAMENMLLWASFYGLGRKEARRRSAEILEVLELSHRAKDRVSTFSGGMKRRLNLALGIIHNPEFLILDEPTVGIDVQARVYIREFLRELASRGTSMLYTTHQLEEAQQLCHRVAIMDAGEILVEGKVEELLKKAEENITIVLRGDFPPMETLRPSLEKFSGKILSFSGEKVALEVENEGAVAGLIKEMLEAGISLREVDIKKPDLEALFLKLTGRELRE